jgi:hypothetical protein
MRAPLHKFLRKMGGELLNLAARGTQTTKAESHDIVVTIAKHRSGRTFHFDHEIRLRKQLGLKQPPHSRAVAARRVDAGKNAISARCPLRFIAMDQRERERRLQRAAGERSGTVTALHILISEALHMRL